MCLAQKKKKKSTIQSHTNEATTLLLMHSFWSLKWTDHDKLCAQGFVTECSPWHSMKNYVFSSLPSTPHSLYSTSSVQDMPTFLCQVHHCKSLFHRSLPKSAATEDWSDIQMYCSFHMDCKYFKWEHKDANWPKNVGNISIRRFHMV